MHSSYMSICALKHFTNSRLCPCCIQNCNACLMQMLACHLFSKYLCVNSFPMNGMMHEKGCYEMNLGGQLDPTHIQVVDGVKNLCFEQIQLNRSQERQIDSIISMIFITQFQIQKLKVRHVFLQEIDSYGFCAPHHSP